MNYDLFGDASSTITEYVLFHDETSCDKSKFLYHSYLLVNKAHGSQLLDELLEIKSNDYDINKEIHFVKIRNKSDVLHGEKTKVALRWLSKAKSDWLMSNKIKYYFFGVNKNNLKNFWNNSLSYDFNVYLRFFEIGLKSAIRWFAEGEAERIRKNLCITHLFFDPKDQCCDLGRKEKIYKVSTVLQAEQKAGTIKKDKIFPLDSDTKKSDKNISNFIQLADVLGGVCRASFVELSKSREGQQECVNEFIDVVERLNCSKLAYRTNAPFYKTFAIQFFPTNSNITFEEFIKGKTSLMPNKSQFYCDRHTYRQAKELQQQQRLF